MSPSPSMVARICVPLGRRLRDFNTGMSFLNRLTVTLSSGVRCCLRGAVLVVPASPQRNSFFMLLFVHHFNYKKKKAGGGRRSAHDQPSGSHRHTTRARNRHTRQTQHAGAPKTKTVVCAGRPDGVTRAAPLLLWNRCARNGEVGEGWQPLGKAGDSWEKRGMKNVARRRCVPSRLWPPPE